MESIRTFEVQTQLSKEQKQTVSVVPDTESSPGGAEPASFTDYLPDDTLLVTKDLGFVHDRIEQTYAEGFARQAQQEQEASSEMEEAQQRQRLQKELLLISGETFLRGVSSLQRIGIGTKAEGKPEATLQYNLKPQPLYHKNFEMLRAHLSQYKADGYQNYILADSAKQTERLQNIFDELQTASRLFTPVERTLHEGFVDLDLRLCLFTDHQIFDRFHKYNLKSDHARDASRWLSRSKSLCSLSRATTWCTSTTVWDVSPDWCVCPAQTASCKR